MGLPPWYLKLVCYDCVKKNDMLVPWRNASLWSSEGLCQWCWRDVSEVGDLCEIDLRLWEANNVLKRSW